MNEFHLPEATHIGHVRLQVSALSEALAFYLDILGFRLIAREGPSASLAPAGEDPSVRREDRPGILFLTELPGARRKPRRSAGLYHVAIRLPDRAALGRLLHHLLEQDWPLQGMSDHLVSEAIYLADPDGNGLELYADRPRERWVQRAGQVQMATEPLDADGLLRAGGTDPWTGIDPRTDVGHVHLHVANLERAEAFYHGLLGLDVTQRSYAGALFLSAGGYHHHVAVNVWAGEGAPPAPTDAVGLLSFGLHLPEAGAWRALLDRVQGAGIRLEEWREDAARMGVLIHDADRIGVELTVDRAAVPADMRAEAQGLVAVAEG